MSGTSKKNLLGLIIFFVAIVATISAVLYYQGQQASDDKPITSLVNSSYAVELVSENGKPKAAVFKYLDRSSEKPFTLELALDDDTRRKGLMHREHIDPNGGMIFIFRNESHHSFWMRNCLTDIDMIFVNDKGRVTAVHHAKKQPLGTPLNELIKYPSGEPASVVIELAGQRARDWNINKGDLIDLPIAELQAIAN